MWCPSIRDLLMFCILLAPQVQYSVQDIASCKEGETPISASNSSKLFHYFYIGSVFALHDRGQKIDECGPVLSRGLQLTEAFLWYINKYKILGHFSVGGVMFDSCSDSNIALQRVLSFETKQITCSLSSSGQISPDITLVYVGADQLPDTMALANALMRTSKTLISPIGKTNLPNMNPYFIQDFPKYTTVDTVLINLFKFNGIRYIVLLNQDEKNWTERSAMFQKKAKTNNICTVYSATLPKDSNYSGSVQELIKDHKKTVYVVVIADDNVVSLFLEEAKRNPDAHSFVYLAIGQTVKSKPGIASLVVIPTVDDSDINNDVERFRLYYKGILNQKPLPTWVSDFCSQQQRGLKCDEVFAKEKIDLTVPFLFLALKTILAAIKDCGTSCTSVRQHLGNNVLNAIKNVKIDGTNENVFDIDRYLNPSVVKYQFRINGSTNLVENNSIKRLDILNKVSQCPHSPCTECGEQPSTTPTTTLVTSGSTPTPTTIPMMLVPRIDFQTGFLGSIPKRTEAEFGVRDDSWVIALGVLASLGVLSVIVLEMYILYKLLGTKLGRQWRTMLLGQLLLIGVLLCYLTLFAYLPKPTDATCGITRFGVGFSYSVVFSVMLVKLMVILTSKSNEGVLLSEGESSNYLRGTYQILMFVFAVGVQLVIDIQWLITIPPKAVPVTDIAEKNVWICNHYTWSTAAGADKAQDFQYNDFENHLLTLIYVMLLILITTGVSMKAHGIVTNHRESVFIGLSAGLSIPLWIAWGLFGGLSRSSLKASQYGDACIAFGLFLNATLILFAMFLPKVRQMVNMGLEGVYLEDDRDTNYAGSVISYRTGYRSSVAPTFHLNGGSVYNSGSIKDPMALHLKHPGSSYSAPVYVRTKSNSVYGGGSQMLKVTPDLTGRMSIDRRRAVSEQNYYMGTSLKPRSEKGSTMSRSRSTQDLGAL